MILNSHSLQMCGGDFHIYIYIYILNLYPMKGNKSAIKILTLNENISLRDYNIYIKWKYPIEGFSLFGTYLTLVASFGVIAWFKEPWFKCARCMSLWFRNIFNSFALSSIDQFCWCWSTSLGNIYTTINITLSEKWKTLLVTANTAVTKRDKWQGKKWVTEKAGGLFKELKFVRFSNLSRYRS